MSKFKDYLGDGVYVDFDCFGFTLTTEDGVRVINEIYLEPAVLDALIRYRERVIAETK